MEVCIQIMVDIGEKGRQSDGSVHTNHGGHRRERETK